MHDALFGSQEQWAGNAGAEDIFVQLAGDLDLDLDQFETCLAEGKYAAKVQADMQEGIEQGVSGTPAFFINGVFVSGAQPFETFQQQIDYFVAGGTPPTMEVEPDSFRSMGDPDAPVVVTEFSDYQCPACASVEQQVIPELIEQYVDTGKVRFVYREFPLTNIHPNAPAASEAAICAGMQDAYWQMHEKLFASQAEWQELPDPVPTFKEYAQELGLDTATFDLCLASGDAAVIVQGDMLAGQTLGVNATPYFFIGDLPIRGGLPIESLGQVIDFVAAGGEAPSILPEGGDGHFLGSLQTAQAVTVAFVDYGNEESAQHSLEVLPQLQEAYIDTGQMLYVLHPWFQESGGVSDLGAIAAECAGQQGSYWEMHDMLFAEQADWTGAEDPAGILAGYAESLDLDGDQFEACQASDDAALAVQGGKIVGLLYGVPGAPVFLFNNGQGQQGSPSFEEFEAIIGSILAP
jgi:protein-disulfide isomerase